MSHEDSVTNIKLCYSLWRNGISPEAIPEQLGIHRATVYRWIHGFKKKGVRWFLRDYQQAKKGRKQPRTTTVIAKIRIFKIREAYNNCCGEKIQYLLKRDYGMAVSVATIYRILGKKYVLRSKWKKYSKRGPIRKGEKARDVLQTDTVDLGNIYAFTTIDTYTRQAHVVLKPSLTARHGKEALKDLLTTFGPIAHIQRDGGSEFKKEWQDYAVKHIPSIRTARPYKKNEQAYIERFNGILRKECVGYLHYAKKDLPALQQKINAYLHYYHTKRPHLSLNMQTPSEFALCRI